MNEAEVIRQMRAHLEGLFPKNCMTCGRRFDTLREYLEKTTHSGSAIPYDAMNDDWKPLKPIGMATFAHCPCGNTLTLTSKGMPLHRLWILMAWARLETKKRSMTPQELLNYLRDEICQQVLSENMQWKIYFEEKSGIVCIYNSGNLTADDIKNQVRETSAFMNKHDSKIVLVDYRKFRSDIPISNIYDLPNFYKEIQFPLSAKVAFLLPVDISGVFKENFKFFETVCVNNGYNVKLFTKEAVARKWLLDPSQSTGV